MDHRQPTALDPDVLAIIRHEGPVGEQSLLRRFGRREELQDVRYALLRLEAAGRIHRVPGKMLFEIPEG